MAQQIINVGNTANDGTGDHLRVGGQKINANFTELYASSLTALTNAHILVGNVSNVPTDVAVTGDISITNTGVVSVLKLLGNTIPSNASGVLKNNGSGTLTWGTSGITNSAAANEIAKSDGTNMVASGIFSTASGDLILGAGSLAGNRTFSVSSSTANADLILSPQASGNTVIKGSQIILAGTNNLELRSTSGNTVYIGHVTANNDVYVTQDTVLSRTIVGRKNAGGILQIFSNATVVGGGVTGSILFDIATPSSGTYGNYGFNVSALPSFGSGEKVIFFGNSITNPSGTISSGGVFFIKSSDSLPYWRTGTTEYAMTSTTSGTVTSVAWTTSQGVSASIATATTTPNITITLGALTGVTSFNGLVITANTGVITTGTLGNGVKILVGSDATGDTYYNGGSGTITRLAIGATSKFYTVSGGVPVWSTSTIPSSAGATANKVLLSDGTNYVLSTPTFPNASATTRKITVSDGTNWVASTETYATPGTSGNILTSDGTNWTSAALSGVWTLPAGGTLTGANTITGTTTNTLTMNFGALGVTHTDGAGIYLLNNAAAANGAQQQSPSVTFGHTVWTTTAGGSSLPAQWFIEAKGFQNATTPQSDLNFGYQLNGGGYNTYVSFRSTNGGAFGYMDIVSGVIKSSSNSFTIQGGTITRATWAATSGNLILTQSAVASAWGPALTLTVGAKSSMTASTEFKDFVVTSANDTWLDGTVAHQRWFHITSPTVLGTTTLATVTTGATFAVDAPTAGSKGAITNNFAIESNGNLLLPAVGQGIYIKEGSGGLMGQVALVTGTKAITINGITTSSRAFITLVTPNTTTLTITYQAVCTANTLTLQANVAAGTINTADISTLNYVIFNPAP